MLPPPLSQTEHLPRVTVLMAVRNGRRFLPEQIDSIAAQKGVDMRLILSDDLSLDGSAKYIESLKEQWPSGRLTVLAGPNRGYAANFVSLVLAAHEDAGLIAFSDQDDVWTDTRLARAAEALGQVRDAPALHVSRRWIADRQLDDVRQAKFTGPRLSFRNALVESAIPGNASIMNQKAFGVVKTALSRHHDVSSHDWAMYQILTGTGARLLFDREPSVIYRQHDENVKGIGRGSAWLLGRVRQMTGGGYAADLRGAFQFLDANHDLLTAESRGLLQQAKGLTAPRAFARLNALRQGRFYRLRWIDQCALWGAVALGMTRAKRGD